MFFKISHLAPEKKLKFLRMKKLLKKESGRTLSKLLCDQKIMGRAMKLNYDI